METEIEKSVVEPRDVYVPVDVNERGPDFDVVVILIPEDGNMYADFLDKDGYDITGVTHWLEKKTGMIVLTKEQFDEIIADVEQRTKMRMIGSF